MIRLFKNWYLRHFSQPGTTEFALVLICAFLMVYYLMWLVGPLVVALCIAYCLDGLVSALDHGCGIGRRFGSVLVMLGFVGFAVLITVLIVPQVIRQCGQFYNGIVALSQETAAQALEEEELLPGYDAGSETFSMTVEDFDKTVVRHLYSAADYLPDPVASMINEDDLLHAIQSARAAVTSYVAEIIRTQLMPSVMNAVSFAMYLIVVPIFTFLMLYNKHVLQKRVQTYLLPNNQVLIHELWPSLNGQIAGYIRGKMLHIIIIAICNTFAFKLMGLNYAFLLGLGVGLSVVVPYVGAVVIAIPVVLVAVMQFGFDMQLVWVLAIYLVIQLLDGNVLPPMLFSKALNLDAFTSLAAILIFGGLWGFWGGFFSIPLATLIKTLIVRWPSTDNDSADPSGSSGTGPSAEKKELPAE